MYVVEAILRKQRVRLSYCLDNLIVLNKLKVKFLQDRSRAINQYSKIIFILLEL